MSKHTPGPWDIYTGDDESIRIATDERRICEMDIYIDDTDMANARLIAAAPYMLEACWGTSKAPKEAVAIMKREGFVIDNLDDRWQKLAFTLYSMLVNNASMAEHAIAKAEGRNA